MSDNASETTHRCPEGSEAAMPCCGRTPFEVPWTDRLTEDPESVTCGISASTAANAGEELIMSEDALRDRITMLEAERDTLIRIVALLVEDAGGSVEIPQRQLDDIDGTILSYKYSILNNELTIQTRW